MLSLAKKTLREETLAFVKSLPHELRTAAADDMLLTVSKHRKYLGANQVAVFISMPHEICTWQLIDVSLQQGKRVFVPKIAGKTMRMLEVLKSDEIHDFSRTKWGIPEPPQDRPELSRGAEQLSKTLLVVPAVAFNYDGTRLGYGGGYYDKFLSELSPSGHIKQDDTFTTIGIGFKCQLIERPIPTNETDFCLDEVRVF